MQKRYKTLFFLVILFGCKVQLQAQNKPVYKNVLLNGKPAKLNPATGEFILTASNGKDSIVNTRNRNNEQIPNNELDYHTVLQGENLLIISKQYGLTLNKIKEENNLETTLVKVGQKLRIRNFSDFKKSKSKDFWVVSKGQTLYYISTQTGISVQALKRLRSPATMSVAAATRYDRMFLVLLLSFYF